MIDLSQHLLGSLFLRSLFLGVILDLFYLLLSLCRAVFDLKGYGERRIVKLSSACLAVFTFFSDLFFCLIGAILSVLLIYRVSGGVFRITVYICVFAGFVITHVTVGKWLAGPIKKVSRFMQKVILHTLRILYIPIRAIFSLIVRFYHLTIGKIIGKIIEERKKRFGQDKNTRTDGLSDASDRAGEETQESAKESGRYRKEGRISFGERS